jgi:hypothetical protein
MSGLPVPLRHERQDTRQVRDSAVPVTATWLMHCVSMIGQTLRAEGELTNALMQAGRLRALTSYHAVSGWHCFPSSAGSYAPLAVGKCCTGVVIQMSVGSSACRDAAGPHPTAGPHQTWSTHSRGCKAHLHQTQSAAVLPHAGMQEVLHFTIMLTLCFSIYFATELIWYRYCCARSCVLKCSPKLSTMRSAARRPPCTLISAGSTCSATWAPSSARTCANQKRCVRPCLADLCNFAQLIA